jgi:hypothetical protein
MTVARTPNETATKLAYRHQILGVFAMLLLLFISAGPTWAQVAVMAQPRSSALFNNSTTQYVFNQPMAYISTDQGAGYVPARLVSGVPPSQFSFIPTNGDSKFLVSTVLPLRTVPPPPPPAPPPGPVLNLTAANAAANTSFGGLIDQFQWGAVDVVMNQCFSGGFAYNVAGSLQGVIPPAGGAANPAPANAIGYTFAAGANFNECGFVGMLPNFNAGAANATAVYSFSQGQAWAEAAPGALSLYGGYQFGVMRDPVVVGSTGFGVPNQTLPIGGPPNLALGQFETPNYASADAPGPANANNPNGTINTTAANNSRSYASNPNKRWALLFATNANLPLFALNIEREYAALISNGVPAGQIAVLYNDGSAGTLAAFPRIAAANNFPAVNVANPVPVVGIPATLANLTGFLNGTTAWPSGNKPASNDPETSLLVYVTGHGGAERLGGAVLTGVNTGPGGQTTITCAVADNLPVMSSSMLSGSGGSGGSTITVQIATQSPLDDDPSTYQVSLASGWQNTQGSSTAVGPLQAVSVSAGTAFDQAALLQPGNTQPNLYYYDFIVPSQVAASMQAGQPLNVTISNPSSQSINDFDNSVLAVTFMNDVATTCVTGSCDFYTDQVTDLTLSASPTTGTVGQPITLTGTVAGNSPTGTVQFLIGGVAVGAPVTVTDGVATLTTTLSTPGAYVVTGYYSGDANNQAGYAGLQTAIAINSTVVVSMLPNGGL